MLGLSYYRFVAASFVFSASSRIPLFCGQRVCVFCFVRGSLYHPQSAFKLSTRSDVDVRKRDIEGWKSCVFGGMILIPMHRSFVFKGRNNGAYIGIEHFHPAYRIANIK